MAPVCFKSLILLAGALVVQSTAKPDDAGPVGIEFFNNNSLPMHISLDWAHIDTIHHPDIEWTNLVIAPGDSHSISAPAGTSPKYYIGATPNERTAEVDGRRNHNTVVEASYVAYADHTYFDVDIEKGFSVPIWCHGAQAAWETGEGCSSDVLAACPAEDRHFDERTGLYDYCIGTESAVNIEVRERLCPYVYVRPDDTRTKTIPHHGHCRTFHFIFKAPLES